MTNFQDLSGVSYDSTFRIVIKSYDNPSPSWICVVKNFYQLLNPGVQVLLGTLVEVLIIREIRMFLLGFDERFC